jgi:hypothetical protein
VGGEIAVGPTSHIPTEHEKFRISAINGNVITLDRPMLYDHYGDPAITLNTTVGTMDMRGVVAYLTRNIKIQGNRESTGWGCRVLVA